MTQTASGVPVRDAPFVHLLTPGMSIRVAAGAGGPVLSLSCDTNGRIVTWFGDLPDPAAAPASAVSPAASAAPAAAAAASAQAGTSPPAAPKPAKAHPLLEKIRAAAERLTLVGVRDELGMADSTLRSMAKRYGIVFAKPAPAVPAAGGAPAATKPVRTVPAPTAKKKAGTEKKKPATAPSGAAEPQMSLLQDAGAPPAAADIADAAPQADIADAAPQADASPVPAPEKSTTSDAWPPGRDAKLAKAIAARPGATWQEIARDLDDGCTHDAARKRARRLGLVRLPAPPSAALAPVEPEIVPPAAETAPVSAPSPAPPSPAPPSPVPAARPRAPLTAAEIEDLRRMAHAGETVAGAARKIGRHKSVVRRAMKRHSIEFRPGAPPGAVRTGASAAAPAPVHVPAREAPARSQRRSGVAPAKARRPEASRTHKRRPASGAASGDSAESEGGDRAASRAFAAGQVPDGAHAGPAAPVACLPPDLPAEGCIFHGPAEILRDSLAGLFDMLELLVTFRVQPRHRIAIDLDAKTPEASVPEGLEIYLLWSGSIDFDIELAARLRARGERGAIFCLSRSIGPDDRGRAINAGADDVWIAPRDPNELVARAGSAVRLSRMGPRRETRRLGNICLDYGKRHLMVGDGEGAAMVALTFTEFTLLDLLLTRGNAGVTTIDFTGAFPESRKPAEMSRDVHLTHIRMKLRDKGANVRIVSIDGAAILRLETPGERAERPAARSKPAPSEPAPAEDVAA